MLVRVYAAGFLSIYKNWCQILREDDKRPSPDTYKTYFAEQSHVWFNGILTWICSSIYASWTLMRNLRRLALTALRGQSNLEICSREERYGRILDYIFMLLSVYISPIWLCALQ
jgi:hypothetical protein